MTTLVHNGIINGPSREDLRDALIFSTKNSEFRLTFTVVDLSTSAIDLKSGGLVGVKTIKLKVIIRGLHLEDDEGVFFKVIALPVEGMDSGKVELYYDTKTRKGYLEVA